jgi:hypothetical protein
MAVDTAAAASSLVGTLAPHPARASIEAITARVNGCLI